MFNYRLCFKVATFWHRKHAHAFMHIQNNVCIFYADNNDNLASDRVCLVVLVIRFGLNTFFILKHVKLIYGGSWDQDAHSFGEIEMPEMSD